jgi:hypothetical protein
MTKDELKIKYCMDSAALDKLINLSGVALTNAVVRNSESTNKKILRELDKKGASMTPAEKEVYKAVRFNLLETKAIKPRKR